jgi:hypothetical protein
MLMQGNPEEELKDHLIVDSGCSGRMTGEKELLSDCKAYFGGKVAFGNDPDGESLAKEQSRLETLILRMLDMWRNLNSIFCQSLRFVIRSILCYSWT